MIKGEYARQLVERINKADEFVPPKKKYGRTGNVNKKKIADVTYFDLLAAAIGYTVIGMTAGIVLLSIFYGMPDVVKALVN